MKFLNLGSIRRNLILLVMLVVLPVLAILLYSGMEQRRQSINEARQDALLLVRTMAEAQKELTDSSRQILSTLALLPQVQARQRAAASAIFRSVLKQNPAYLNISLTDLDGEVLASGLPFTAANLRDRKHFREALAKKDFAVGEYIISRVGSRIPAFAFAYPVLDGQDRPTAVLTIAITLDHFSRFHDVPTLTENSFVAVTDHQGIRLFYHPPMEANPIGRPIRASNWEIARSAREPRIFISEGSDGIRRLFAFEPVRLAPEDPPYLFVWAGIPEVHILGPANRAMVRNLLLMLLAMAVSLAIAWAIGRSTLLSPIQSLVAMTRSFAAGDLRARSAYAGERGELGALTRSFHDMAAALAVNQETLRANEARFRLLLDSLDAFVYVADMKTYEVLFINEYGRRNVGDITGTVCWQTLQKDQAGPCSFCTNPFLLDADGRPGRVHTWEFRSTVTGRWYDIHDRAIQWTDGRIVRLEIATDITERKVAETRLAEERELLAVTLRSIGDGVITTDTDGRIVLINKVAEILTGRTGNEAAGRLLGDVFTIIDQETRGPVEDPVGRILASGRTGSAADEILLVSRQGPERAISYSGAPILTGDGRIIGVVLVFRDITNQLRTEQELIKGKKLEALGVLAGGIAHDFNNILAAILGNIDLSLLDGALTPRTRTLLQEASKATYRARDLTQQLLTFSKGGEPVRETASLPDVVRESATFVLHGDPVACRFSIPDDLWLVDIDRGQISQVVQNIILNARDAMPGGGTIDVSCENAAPGSLSGGELPREGRFVKLTITDSGAGIPAGVLDRIFDPFFSTKKQGSGLGLAITHSIVSKHGGFISVRSTPGEGTSFAVYLPASERGSLPAVAEEKAVTPPRQARILVMDDDEQVRGVTKAILEQLGHEVALAEDGMEAVRLYTEARGSGSPFDLMIMDLTIPGRMGGREALQQILAHDADAKAVVASGYSNDPVMANFRDHGFRAAITKPFQLQELSRTIAELLS